MNVPRSKLTRYHSLDVQQNGSAFVESVKASFTPQKIESIAEQTKDFSYGDLEGIINAIKTDADILKRPMVKDDIIDIVVDRAVTKYNTFTGSKYLGSVED